MSEKEYQCRTCNFTVPESHLDQLFLHERIDGCPVVHSIQDTIDLEQALVMACLSEETRKMLMEQSKDDEA